MVRSRGMLTALLGPDLDVALQLRWAVHLARARELDLLILHRIEGREERVADVALDEPPGDVAVPVISELRRLIDASPDLRAGSRENAEPDQVATEAGAPVTEVSLKLLHFTNLTSLRRMVLGELVAGKIEHFTLARANLFDMSDRDLVRERRLFLRYIPCEIVLCHGLTRGTEIARVLVAAAPGPNGRAALQLGQRLAASADGTLTALHVNPDIGPDAERVGERRLARVLGKLPDPEHPALTRRVVVNDQVHRGVRQVWDEGDHDLLLVGAPRVQIEGSIGTKLGQGVPVVMVSAGSPIGGRFREFVEETVERFVPQIEREDRVALVDRVQSSAAWNFDFIALMVLSTTMAAIGLIQNSAAVVIGAMLVAPLMTPLLGLGLALVQGNPVLARVSLRSIALGLCVSLVCGFLVGLATLSFQEPTREMLGRGQPGLLDLAVAFAAGLAAAYASSRPGLIAALPGVAIAAALVPPIATSGLALSLGDVSLAAGALLLFGINMVTIVLASMASLWLVGLRNVKKTSTWTWTVGGAVLVSVLGLGVYLSVQSTQDELTGRLPVGLVAAVRDSLGKGYRLESVAVAYDELGVQLNVRVIGRTPAPEELATIVRTLASDHYDQPVRVRMVTQIEIDAAPAPPTPKKRPGDTRPK